MSQGDGAKKTQTQGADKEASHSLVGDLLRRAASPEVLAGMAGAAAAARFTKHAVDQSEDDESGVDDESTPEAEYEHDDGSEAESDERPEDESAEVAQGQSDEDESKDDDMDAGPSAESRDEADVGGDQEAGSPSGQADDENGEGEADRPRAVNGSLGSDDERMQLLARAREYAEQMTGHPVESFSGLAQEERGWRVGMEIVEVSRVPSTTDVLASYEVVLTGDGDLVDFRRAGRYYRNETGNSG